MRIAPFLFATIFLATSLNAQSEGKNGWALYGQINRAVLWYDDGEDAKTYLLVDNSKSVSRIGLTYDRLLQDNWHFQARGEIGLNWKETNNINQLDENDSNYQFHEEGIRKLEVSFEHPTYGTFFIGQGAMASDGITGQDLSLTNVVAGAAVKDMAGGLLLRREDGTLSNIRILDRFPTLGSSRRLRLRYDRDLSKTVQFAIAAGREVLDERDGRYYADAALRYDETRGDYRIKAGAAYRWVGGNPDTEFREEDQVVALSGSVLHRPSRFNISASYGFRFDSGSYYYAKLGRRYYKLLPVGWTAFSIDHYFGRDVATGDDRSDSTGVAVVQQIKDYNMDVYLAGRTYDVSDTTTQYQRSYAVLAGARWRF